MYSFVALCALFGASLSAMELPQNNNNNTVPQATARHVPTLKELASKKVAQQVAAECEKYGPKVTENVATICEKFADPRAQDCLDDLIKAAATEGESKSRSITNYRCTHILSEKILMNYDIDECEIYDIETQKSTGVIDGSGKVLLSPAQDLFADIDVGLVKIYQIDHTLVNDLGKRLVHKSPSPYCKYVIPIYAD